MTDCKLSKAMIITPKTYSGGAEHVASRLSRHFQCKYDVSVVSFDCKRKDYSYSGSLIDLNVPIGSSYKKLYSIFFGWRRLNSLKNKIAPSFSLSLIDVPNIVNILSNGNEHCIVSVRTYMKRSKFAPKRFLQKKLVNHYYNKADIVVAICEAIKYDLVDYYHVKKEKVKVIYPFFDIKEIEARADDELDNRFKGIFNSSDPVIITSGRLTYDKGQWHLIKAFGKVKEKFPGAKLVILGRGDLELRLKKLALATGFSDDIHFLGYLANPYKYIKRSSLFVFPSLIEGFGNALAEAMACGIPVISTDCNFGPREIIAPQSDYLSKATETEVHDNGVLIPEFGPGFCIDEVLPSDNETRLSIIINKLLEDKELRVKMQYSAKIRAQDFDINSITPQWDSVVSTM